MALKLVYRDFMKKSWLYKKNKDKNYSKIL